MLVIYQPISGRRLLPLFASRPQSQNLTQLSPLVGAEVGLTGILASEVTDSGSYKTVEFPLYSVVNIGRFSN
jgi:hypothetical protein